MFDITRFEEILSELCDELPDEFYEGLSGGVNLNPELKIHPESRGEELAILGEYQVDSAGTRVVIYYGSFERNFFYLSDEDLVVQMRKTLRHEFRHHLERRAGQRDLEIEDKIQIMKYKGRIEDKNC